MNGPSTMKSSSDTCREIYQPGTVHLSEAAFATVLANDAKKQKAIERVIMLRTPELSAHFSTRIGPDIAGAPGKHVALRDINLAFGRIKSPPIRTEAWPK